jgi:tripartite-type tricarboxylate transporter receptor subunit TctC
MYRRALVTLSVAAACGATTLPSLAQTWPTKAIKFVVPYPPGGPVDSIVRLITPSIEKELGQPVVVDNKAGAAGMIGIASVVQAEPDGYTFGVGVLGILAVAPHIGKMPFKMEDVNYVTLLTQSPHVFVLNPAQGYGDLKGLIAAARKAPGTLNYGSPGTGSSTHLDGELLQQEAKVDLLHVPYKGGAAALNALFSNEVQMLAVEISAALPLQSKVKIAAVMGSKRSPQLPDVPTTAELGFPNVVASSIYGVIAPTKTPPAITEKFRKAVVDALNQPEVKQWLASQGQAPLPGTPAEYRQLMEAESAKWGAMIKGRNVKFE